MYPIRNYCTEYYSDLNGVSIFTQQLKLFQYNFYFSHENSPQLNCSMHLPTVGIESNFSVLHLFYDSERNE